MLGTMNKLGVVGTVATTALNLGCCAPQALGPLTGILFAGGLLDRIPAAWQLPSLYGSLTLALAGLGLGWRRHRRPAPLLLGLSAAPALLYPFHEALDVWILELLIWLGFGLLLAAAIWDTVLSFRACRCRYAPLRLEDSQR